MQGDSIREAIQPAGQFKETGSRVHEMHPGVLFYIRNIRTRRMRSSRSRCRCRCRCRRDLPHCPRHPHCPYCPYCPHHPRHLCRLHCLHCPHRLHRPHHPHGPYGPPAPPVCPHHPHDPDPPYHSHRPRPLRHDFGSVASRSGCRRSGRFALLRFYDTSITFFEREILDLSKKVVT